MVTLDQRLMPLQKLVLSRPQSLLFYGPSQKALELNISRLLGLILCETQQNCGHCLACKHLAAGTSNSVLKITPKNGLIRIEEAHQAVHFFSLQSESDRFVWIEEAHLLNPSSGNSLLKTLEEPPVRSHFLLSSTNRKCLLPTLRSRCLPIFVPEPLVASGDSEVRKFLEALSLGQSLAKWRDQIKTRDAIRELCEQSLENLRPLLLVNSISAQVGSQIYTGLSAARFNLLRNVDTQLCWDQLEEIRGLQ